MSVGQSILTVRGIYAFTDASATGKPIKPKYYKVTDQDLNLDPELTDIPMSWKQADISGYIPIDDTTVEFLVDIPPEEATKYGRTFGLFLEDGALFMIAKPPYPFPPALHQTFKIQLVYQNVSQLVDFQYLPFYETEQDLAALDAIMSLGGLAQALRGEVEQLKRARERLFQTDREFEGRISRLEEEVRNVEENQIALAVSFYTLASIVQKNTVEAQRILNGLKLY